ncbi:MAG: right-handed parallel beta-helix repeat-containing protein [Verrucomicrobiales bacterium]
MKYSFRSTALGFACLACAALSPAAITVNGVSDEQVVATAATVTVPSESGFLIEADLNGEPIALDTPVRVDQPGYYELHATKVPDGGGAGESRTVKFIIRNTDRGNSEWGLESWVPTQAIDSAPAEFAGASFAVMAPAAFPQGLPIPVIARLKNEDGSGRRVNGHAFAPELPGVPLRLRRGWGGELLAAADQGGAFLASWELNGLSAPIEIAIDESTVWQEVSGDLGGDADWGENARIHITGDLTIPAGATLTVGAGTVVQIAPGADIDVIGALQIDGTKAEPCVFCPEAGGAAWGGFLCEAGTARVNATAAIFTGAGADGSWFSGSGYHSHRREQATFIFADGAQGEFTDCAILKQPGQSLHGDNATLTLRGCLIKNVPTVGQFNGGAVSVNDSALIEFPDAESWFSDDDNDGIYFTEGGHELIDTVVGWAKDDGVDAGSGDSGTVTVSNCWFEACFHEGMAWSGGYRSIDVSDTVAINCGQGLEAGCRTGPHPPDVVANRVLAVGNLIGWRFGDNYDWDYLRQLQASATSSRCTTPATSGAWSGIRGPTGPTRWTSSKTNSPPPNRSSRTTRSSIRLDAALLERSYCCLALTSAYSPSMKPSATWRITARRCPPGFRPSPARRRRFPTPPMPKRRAGARRRSAPVPSRSSPARSADTSRRLRASDLRV